MWKHTYARLRIIKKKKVWRIVSFEKSGGYSWTPLNPCPSVDGPSYEYYGGLWVMRGRGSTVNVFRNSPFSLNEIQGKTQMELKWPTLNDPKADVIDSGGCSPRNQWYRIRTDCICYWLSSVIPQLDDLPKIFWCQWYDIRSPVPRRKLILWDQLITDRFQWFGTKQEIVFCINALSFQVSPDDKYYEHKDDHWYR